MVRLQLPALLALAFILAACGGTSDVGRSSAKQGDDACWIVSDVAEAGSPCLVRCRISGDPDFDLLRFSWSWGASNGRIVHQTADGSEAWVAMDNPGACWLQARGVDKDGKDCTTPRHRIMSGKKFNAAPVIDCDDEPEDTPFDRPGDDGSSQRYHEWRWRCAIYDPDDPGFEGRSELEITRLGDLDRDGIPDVVVAMAGDGSVRIAADLDGDGVDDDCDGSVDRTFPALHVFEVRCPSKSKEDVYVWKVRAGGGGSRKEFKGHVTLMK